ncbi:MAG TPA: YceI family protein [Saprospiraceae bacterium]|nr:YceI family protein [Saprospiraceae bacterium]
MNKLLFSLLFSLGLILHASAGTPEDGYYKILPSASTIAWKAKKVTGQHHGSVGLKEGTLQMKKGVLSGGHFTIDMATIKDLDMQGEYAQKLERHLKSDDFFNVEQYPTATLIILKSTPKGENNFTIDANLTIRGITQPIQFDATVIPDGKKINATATMTIDRSLYNVKYGSGKFFDNLGDKTIDDHFNLDISLVSE